MKAIYKYQNGKTINYFEVEFDDTVNNMKTVMVAIKQIFDLFDKSRTIDILAAVLNKNKIFYSIDYLDKIYLKKVSTQKEFDSNILDCIKLGELSKLPNNFKIEIKQLGNYLFKFYKSLTLDKRLKKIANADIHIENAEKSRKQAIKEKLRREKQEKQLLQRLEKEKEQRERKHTLQRQKFLDKEISRLKNQLNKQEQYLPGSIYNATVKEYLNQELSEYFDNFSNWIDNNSNFIISVKENIPTDNLATSYNRQQLNSRFTFIQDYIDNRFIEVANIINTIINKYNTISDGLKLNILKSKQIGNHNFKYKTVTNKKFPSISFNFVIQKMV